MKKFFILILCFAAATLWAQDDSQPGRISVTNAVLPTSYNASGAQPLFQPLLTPVTQSSGAIAEQITPDIQALAGNLGNDPTRIFNFVHDQIKYVHYFGSLKGAELTLLERAGNDFDQCSLLSSLLQAAGYSPAYQFGYMQIPYDGTNNQDLHHWLGLSLQNTNWNNTVNYFTYLLGKRGFYMPWYDMGDSNTLGLARVWLTLSIGGTNYYLDPSFKVSLPVSGINLSNAMSLNTNTLTTAAGGTDTGYSVSGLNEAAVRTTLQNYNSNLLAYISNNLPNASVAQVVGGRQIVPSSGLPLSTSLLFPILTDSSTPLVNWTNVPTNFMSTFSISFGGTNQTWLTPQLQGQRISLTFSSNGLGQLWLEDSNVLQTSNTGTSSTLNVILTAQHPYGGWNSTLNIPVDTGWGDTSSTNAYLRTNSSYAIMYGFEASPQWLQARQRKLDAYRAAGLADTSRQVTTETLNVMGLGWIVQTELSLELLCQEWGLLPHHHHRFGRMAQEKSRGYYVDVYLQEDATFPSTGYNAPDQAAEYQVFDVSSYVWSAMEHGIIEQLQNSNLVAASTVKMLEIASTNSQLVYLASSTNWTSGANIRGNLSNYGGTLTTLDNLIAQGYYLLLPKNGSNHVAGAGTWAGNGYVELSTGNGRTMGMIIGGTYNGGYDSDPSATVNPPYVSASADALPTTYTSQSATAPIPAPVGADPVNLADGTFQISSTDLSAGQTEPRGLSFSRFYSSARRNSNPAGMAPGWLHNYYCTALPISDPEAGLGQATVQQMAPMIVTTFAALNLYNNTNLDPKNWMTTALIAKWGIDQLENNAVSISLGNATVEFTRQPGGSFTPPANCTMSLTAQTNGTYWLSERHGRTFKFGHTGYLTNIIDQYSQGLTLSYNSNSLVTNITDWQGRSFAFRYTGSNLASITNTGTGRAVSFGYTANANGQMDLTSVTDPTGATSSYQYDTNHEIIATFDALSQLVVTNNYDGFGHITTQLTQGDTNKLWQVFTSGYYTVEIDPAGGQQTYTYDSKSRLIAYQDAMGNLTQTAYDGQDHITQTVSPLGETNQFFYDTNNDLIASVDSLGHTNQFFYDANFNMVLSVDKNGNSNHFGYNSKFQLIASTNGAGDWFTNYYSPTNGLLLTRTDSAGTTTYGYDGYGQLSSVIYPNGLGTNQFINNTLGDVITNINPRGGVTTFLYSARRELRTNIVAGISTNHTDYDAVGNAQWIYDARGFATYNSWSPTRHLQWSAYPTTPQGVPYVTYFRDNRDWLTGVQNPLVQVTAYAYDAAQNKIQVRDALYRTNYLNYDADGRQTNHIDPASNTSYQYWTQRGQLAMAVNEAGNASSNRYDNNGNLTNLYNFNNKLWTFAYDAANRLTNTASPLGKHTAQVFNNRNLLQSATDASGQSTAFYYDARGRLTNRTDNVATTTYQYDFNGNRSAVLENGLSNTWKFDSFSRLTNYTDSAGNLVKYAYDANGNLTNLTYPGNRAVSYAYDSLNRLTNVTDWANRKTTYTYDLASRLTSVVRPNGTVRSNFYDAAGELTNIVEQAATKAPIAFFKLNYNLASQVQWEFAAPLPATNSLPSRAMLYDADDRLTNFNGTAIVNDNNGNMNSGPLTNSTTASYSYDARNRLTSAGTLNYGYDPANNRVAITNGTNVTLFVVDPKTSQVLMRIKAGVTNYYIYGVGLIYEEGDTAASTTTLTYHFDSRGSTVALTDGNGNVTDRFQYSAYGMLIARGGGTDTPFQYNGKYGVQTDINGLLYMRNRYYNPYICRFINADPSGFNGGLNRFAYANGNPISMIDPFGLGAQGEESTSTWVQFQNVLTSGDTWWQHLAYTGQINPTEEEMNGATDAAGDYTYDYSPVRGAYLYGGIDIHQETPGITGGNHGEVIGLGGYDLNGGFFAGGLAAGGTGPFSTGFEKTTGESGLNPIVLVDSPQTQAGQGIGGFATPGSQGQLQLGIYFYQQVGKVGVVGGGFYFDANKLGNYFNSDYWKGNLP